VLTGDNHATYEGLFLVQGAGGPRGAGVLVDRSGDDTYLAHPGDADNIFVTAPVFDETGNWSAAQGAGIGLPSDTPANGGDLSGGLGMLVDFAGTDDYSAGVMAGGAGYWHGIGILVEGNGGDHFETHGAAQGTGLDFGVGVLAEQAGDDVYNSDAGDEARVLGSGYNFGVGLVIEESGGDEYHSADNSLGTGDLNGTGVVIENGGNDIYTVTGTNNLGKAALTAPGYEPEDNPRRAARTIGLFVDAAGSDTYTGRADNASIANGSVWTQQAGGAGGDSLIEWGIGADTEGGTGVSTIE
jgi:hypothetical protein